MNHALLGWLAVFGAVRLPSSDATTTPPADIELRFRISELAPRGEHIGWINGNGSTAALNGEQNYFIAFPDQTSAAEKLLNINDSTGKISVRNLLDYEREKELHFIAMPAIDSAQSAGVKVIIEIIDANDNSPRFPTDKITLNISETARVNTELALPPAADADSNSYTVKKYRIVDGNVNNMFRVTSHTFNVEHYVDLIVNGQLDREFRDRYDLVIEALDGGDPPRKGKITVHVVVLDANDNAPEFLRPRYFTSIPRDAPPNFPVVKITANDADVGDNGRVTYKIITDETHDAETSQYFKIDEDSGLVTIASRQFASASRSPFTALTIIVGATDHGQPSSLESTTLLTITIADNKAAAAIDEALPPALDVVWLTDDGTATVKESAPIGYIIARIAVEDAEDNSRLTLSKFIDPLCLRQTERSTVYLLLVCGALDREKRAVYAGSLLLRRGSDDSDVVLEHPLRVTIIDVNDNAPIWPSEKWRIKWRCDRFNDVRLTAMDLDDGENARLRYELSGIDVFAIHSETGRLSATDMLDCTTGSIRFRVRAEDNGVPRISSSIDVVIELIGFGDVNQLCFSRSIYEITVNENATQQSQCILQMTADTSERRCENGGGEAPYVRYAVQRLGVDLSDPFHIEETSGQICLIKPLDFEVARHHELIVTAAGDGGVRSTSTRVLVYVEDADDSAPTFYSSSYRLALRADFVGDPLIAADQVWQRVLSVIARDPDDTVNRSTIAYSLQYSDEDQVGSLNTKLLREFFRINRDDGTVFLREPMTITRLSDEVPTHFQLKILATDTAGHISQPPAVIDVDLLNAATSDNCGVAFNRRFYEFDVTEDLMPGIAVGRVDLDDPASENYSLRIVDEDRSLRFAFDEAVWGKLVLHGELDAETQDVFLLTVEARHKTIACSRNFTQLKITVQDVNDNAPVFLVSWNVSLTLIENFPIHRPFFHVHAVDADRDENGRIVYELLDSYPPAPIVIGVLDGALRLTAPLDRERVASYRLRVRARDGGVPPRFAVTYVDVHVTDVNDNAPQFEQTVYSIDVAEDAAPAQVLATVRASDADAMAAGTLTYRMTEKDEFFGIDPISGSLYLRRLLDHERQDVHMFIVVAEDGGTPRLAANASVRVRVVDVNDHAPDCASVGTLILPASRRNPSDTPIGLVRATDPDNGVNGTLIYRLQLPHPLFDVKPRGDVYLRKPLSDLLDTYTLSVVVEDGGTPPLVSVCRLRIRISGSDMTNDDGPLETTVTTLVPRLPTISTVGDATAPLLCLTGELTDGDGLLNVALQSGAPIKNGLYFQLDGDTSKGYQLDEIFELDELNGDLYLRDTWALRSMLMERSVDKLDLRVMTLASDATADRLGFNRTTLVFDASALRRTLARRFDAPLYRWNVSEKTEIGSIIGRVVLVSSMNDAGRPLHYRIANEFGGCGDGSGDEANCFFRVDAETGDLLLQRPLDSSISRHVVVVEAAEDPAIVTRSDRDPPKTVVVVQVIDENDHAPEFLSRSNYTLTVADFQRADEPIHHFVAVDRDVGAYARLTYEFAAGNERKMFEIDPHNGALMVRNWTSLLSRRFPLNLRVRATDCASDCRPSDERRHIEQLFTVFADKSLTVGRSVKSAENYFPRGHTLEFTMTADAPPNTVVYNFKRNDDIPDPIVVTFRVFPRFDSPFTIGERDGILKTTRMLNESTYSAIVLALRYSKRGVTHADRAFVTVRVGSTTVRRPQIAPATCSDIVVPENVVVPNLAQIFAHLENGGDDQRAGLHYKIEGGSGSRKQFAIDEKTGVVSCVELDREEKEEHLLVISVADGSTPPKVDVCTLRVRVLDENDNTPRFDDTTTPDTVEIDDAATLGGTVARLRARDVDAGDNGRLHYRLTADRSRMLDVDADTGDLIFAREFAFAGTDWIVTVTVQDCGSTRIFSAEKHLRIIWRRRPLAPTTLAELVLRGRPPPRFLRRRYIGVVPENGLAGHVVARLDTDWPRGPPYFGYRIVSGDSDSAFTVDEHGDLRTTRALDAERHANYWLRIVAEPPGGVGGWISTPETTVDIHVLNINDNPPVLAPLKPIVLDEDLAVGSLVATATAIDADAGSTLEFTLHPVSQHFAIGRYTAAVVLTRGLDREEADLHTIGLQVYDGEHVTRANLTIRVRDVNDNAPRFDTAGALTELEVEDGGWPGAILKRFSATDRDIDVNGALRYTLVGEAANATRRLFAVNESTGDLILLRRLIDGDERFLEIQVSDGGTPPRSAVLSVRVLSVGRVQDTVEDGLLFNASVIRLSAIENHPPFLPFANASDWLLAGCRPTTDWRIESPGAVPFAIHPSTGELYATVALDREQAAEWRFRIGADSKFVDVFVTVIDINDNGPVFSPATTWNVKKISANTSGVVARFNAVDADVLNNSRLTYELLATELHIDRDVFLLNETSGVLSLRWDDRLIKEMLADMSPGPIDPLAISLPLVIGARDGGVPSNVVVADVMLSLDLSDCSGGAPRFVTCPLRKFVLETKPTDTRLFNAAAVSRWPASYRSRWTYTIESVGGSPAQLLTINATTAVVTLAGRLDYETLAVHSADSPTNTARLEYRISVTDALGRHASAPLELYVVGVDEFAPVFGKLSYTFQVPFDTEAGAWLGAVDATDRDAGTDGCVRFEWRADGVGRRKSSLAKYFRLNATSGAIHLRRPIPPARLQQTRTARDEDSDAVDIVRLTIIASSGPSTHPLSSKAVVYFEVAMDWRNIGKKPRDMADAGDRLRRVVATLGTSTATLLAVFGALLLCLIPVTIARVRCCRTGGGAKIPARRSGVDEATKRRQVYSVANSARLPLAADDTIYGGGLPPSPTLAKVRLPPPPSRSLYASRANPSDMCALMASAAAGGSSSSEPLSQPDSGIDPDGASLGSVVAVFQFDAAAGRTAQILSTHNFRPYQPTRNGSLFYGDLGLR